MNATSNVKIIVRFSQWQWCGMPVDVACRAARAAMAAAVHADSHQHVLLYSEQIVENGKFSSHQAANAHGPPEFQAIAAHV